MSIRKLCLLNARATLLRSQIKAPEKVYRYLQRGMIKEKLP